MTQGNICLDKEYIIHNTPQWPETFPNIVLPNYPPNWGILDGICKI